MWATPAFAGTYVSISGGAGLHNDSKLTSIATGAAVARSPIAYKTGIPVVGALGYSSDSWRVEAALGYQLNTINTFGNGAAVAADSHTSVLSVMANGYYDVNMDDSSLSPYLTAGLGVASVTLKEAGFTNIGRSEFAWQVGAGLGIKASDQVIVDLGYRYFRATDANNKAGTEKGTFATSNILAGIRYNF